jgi:glycosyltransferase involved in cell wall biosynthesis
MTSHKILHVTSYYPPHVGGQEVAAQDLVRHLRNARLDVQVVTSDLGSVRGVRVEDGVRVSRLRSSEFPHTPIIWSLPYWLLRRTTRDTIVHLHTAQVFTPEVVWLASKIVGFKYIIHFHGDFTAVSAIGRILPLYKRLLLNRVLRDASSIVTITYKHMEEIRQSNPRTKNIKLISNGIADDFFDVPRKVAQDKPRFLFVGRLSPHKNVAALLKALEVVDPELELDIVGDGECREQLARLASAKNLHGVKFHGSLPRDSVKHFYSTCSALILPSTFELQGIVLLEAMACRAPVIVSQESGLASMIQGSGIIVEPTPHGIASGIKEFLSMGPGDIDSMTFDACTKVRELSLTATARTYINLYKTVAAEGL